jgi:hypothetical protein
MTPGPNRAHLPLGRRVRTILIVVAVLAFVSSVIGTRDASAIEFGNSCQGRVHLTAENEMLVLAGESKWDTDHWHRRPPPDISPGGSGDWVAEGGAFRGCHFHVTYHVECSTFCLAGAPPIATVEFSQTNPWDRNTPTHWHCDLVRGSARINYPHSYCAGQTGTEYHAALGARHLYVPWRVQFKDLCVPNTNPWGPPELCFN